jgi:hypothetical protein
MEQPKKVIVRKNAFSTLPLKLAGMFAIAFAFFFVLLMAFDLFSGFVGDQLATQQATTIANIAIDPRVATELQNVLAARPEMDAIEVSDPFLDRAGLSGVAASTGGGLIPGVNTSLSTASQPLSPRSGTSLAPSSGTAVPAPPGAPVPTAMEATRARYHEWVRRGGDGPLDPRVFSIDSIVPVGIVDGGTGGQQVMFYSEAIDKTVSFAVGTMFFDGWLSELRPEGVVFSSIGEPRTHRMLSWARSIKGDS